MNALRSDHIIKGVDGKKWISINRQKTGVNSSIPLLPQAEAILEKYGNDLRCQYNGKLLPVFSNQKMNDYIKVVAALCSIQKELTMHVARKTFGMLMLANGVSMETVSAMLGHSNIAVTQKSYAQIKKFTDWCRNG